jgi:hypothetical protein
MIVCPRIVCELCGQFTATANVVVPDGIERLRDPDVSVCTVN